MRRALTWFFLAAALAAIAGAEGTPAAPAAAPALLPLPEANPFACDADTPPGILTREVASGIRS